MYKLFADSQVRKRVESAREEEEEATLSSYFCAKRSGAHKCSNSFWDVTKKKNELEAARRKAKICLWYIFKQI